MINVTRMSKQMPRPRPMPMTILAVMERAIKGGEWLVLVEEVVGLGYWELEAEDDGHDEEEPDETMGLMTELLMAIWGWGLEIMSHSNQI